MKLIKVILIMILLILFVCCSQDDSGFDREYDLKNNECIDVKGTEFSLCFESVNDSRCPTNGVCVWEGNAAVDFVLNSKTNKKPFTLNTQRNFQRDTVINGLKID